MTNRNFTPSAVILNKAIKEIVDQGTTETAQVQAQLEKDQPTWNLPARRVSKFVKRNLSGSSVDEKEEEMSTGGSFRRFFSKKSKASKSNDVPAPVQEEVTKDAEEGSLEPTVDTEGEHTAVAKEIYVDDNDGKKEMGCWCN
eukprot:CAMPEP_0172450932 /NCGR_PEP_ID=MMETSP1065-20121228/9116_1 /TAXON_ID=265537 /ORGANISM="Amphiprora paludosa, Strain CCMP125" /LENGTH=141 /DNA_ID=CAMNT_0013202785 /DNA_START=157 /DNA_END=582 /DNA_ORIENTATION=+